MPVQVVERTTVREAASLASPEVGHLGRGTAVTVVEERLVDGHIRARLANESLEEAPVQTNAQAHEDRQHRVVREYNTVTSNETTLGDKLMLLALASQLVNYGVAAVCLQHKEERVEAGLEEMSDEVTMFAGGMGFMLVGVQVAGVVYTYLDEKGDEKVDKKAGSKKGKKGQKKTMPKPKPEPEPESAPGGQKYMNPLGAVG